MLALMLDPGFKCIWLVANYYGREPTFVLVKEYDVGLLLPLLM